jgi:glyoxylase-like metal-dependent hydrolase (beta-lactamase superfamily II)
MPKVWTRKRAGTDPLVPAVSRFVAAVVRNPVSDRPQIHQIELPLSWRKESRETALSTPTFVPDWTEVYLIEGDPLTLIDSGVRSEESRAALQDALDRLGYRFDEIERVIVTHAHRDHFGLVQTLRNEGAKLECWVHEADAGVVEGYSEAIRGRLDGMTAFFHEFGVPEWALEGMYADCRRELSVDEAEAEGTSVERRLEEGDQIEWKDWSLRVLHSPGHTPGHILLEDAEAGLLFTGDHVMGQAVPHAENFYLDAPAHPADALRRRPRFEGLVEMRRSLRALRGRRDQWLLPGYGVAIQRAARTVRDTLLYYEVRLQRIERGLRQLAAMGQDVTAFEIWKALFSPGASSARSEVHPDFDVMRSQLLLVIGALDCLEADDLLVTERRPDGVLTHSHR